MIKTSVEKLSKDIGFDIGMSDDVTQANLLNGFCGALKSSMDDHHLGTQLCYIVEGLNKSAKHIICELAEYVKLEKR